MEGYEIDACLESMIILVDTREQPSARAMRRYKRFGCPYRRQKLDFGDYCYSFTLQGVELIAEDSVSPKPEVVIERKASLEELSGNLAQNRGRFMAEMDRAKEAGASVYLLIENASLDDVLSHNYETRLNPAAYFHTLTMLMARYSVNIVFCKSQNSGEVIKEILYRELKERLEAGKYA